MNVLMCKVSDTEINTFTICTSSQVNFQRNNPSTLVGHIGLRNGASIAGGLHSIQQRELSVDAPHSGTEIPGFSESAILSLPRRVGFSQ